jgi:hypothetical protein
MEERIIIASAYSFAIPYILLLPPIKIPKKFQKQTEIVKDR